MNTKLAKTSELTGQELDRAVHFLLHPNEPIKDGCTAPPYSSDWCFGGPIIEREEIFLAKSILGGWTGSIYVKAKDYNCIMHAAPTPLIAAMRVYVASTLGDEIELPSSLFETLVD